MKEELNTFVSNEVLDYENASQEMMVMGGTILCINLVLMLFTVLYRTNGSFHLQVAGKPL